MARREQRFLSVDKNIDVDESQDAIKNAPGAIHAMHIYNKAAAASYVKLYDALSANVVVGTTVPFMTIPVPAGAAIFMQFPDGIDFATGIAIAATTGVADNNAGAPAANDVVVNTFYK